MLIQRHQEVNGNTIEMNQLQIITTILLIFLLITIMVFCSNLNSKQQDKGKGGIKRVEIMVPLKHLSNFWRTLKMFLINCEISLQLKQSKDCIPVAGTAANQEPKFEITDGKLYVPVVTLSRQDNVKLLKQLEFGFKRTTNSNKYQSKTINLARNRYLDF